MKILFLILIVLALAGFLWINHELNRVANETPHTCPIWLADSPQAGCEVSK